MSNETTVDVCVMGQEFRIHCTENECEGLLLAVDFLDKKMREIKSGGKIVGTERIAIAAALNITHELLNMHAGKGFDIKEFRRRIGLIESKPDDALLESDHQS
ncbi:MAG: cell division protein ZapA [Nitrosomonas sp.]|nr:cell division protein ZapA [Nitrosomonas sp.]